MQPNSKSPVLLSILVLEKTVIDTIIKINSGKKTSSVSTFDFSTLHTNIWHHKLESVIGELINFCFIARDREFIGIIGLSCNNNIDCFLIKH